jgi:hypothetical protein
MVMRRILYKFFLTDVMVVVDSETILRVKVNYAAKLDMRSASKLWDFFCGILRTEK